MRTAGRGKLWLELVGLPAAAAVLALAAWLINPPSSPIKLPVAAQPGELNPVGIDETVALHRAGVTFLDVRDEASFNRARVPGALRWAGEGPSEVRPVVVYGDDLDKAAEAGQKLLERGFSQVFVFVEGMAGWLAAGLPTSPGDVP